MNAIIWLNGEVSIIDKSEADECEPGDGKEIYRTYMHNITSFVNKFVKKHVIKGGA